MKSCFVSTIRLVCVLSLSLQCYPALTTFQAKRRLKDLQIIHKELEDQLTGTATRKAILLAHRRGNIPPIIHQTWKHHNLPALYKAWSSTWSTVNTGWLHIIWSDDENQRLVEQFYPSFLGSYNSLPHNICRADAVRPMILHRYGGIYADLDSEALRPMDELFRNKKVVLGRMGENLNFAHSIPNAFMASAADQHFWVFFLNQIRRSEAERAHRPVRVETIAGPVALKAAIDIYKQISFPGVHVSDVTLLPPGIVYPVDWSAKKRGKVPHICDWGGHRKEFNSSACIRLHYHEAYSVQWWTHAWT